MGRKPILPSQRAQPISFSLKPHLIEKIDDYAADLRFSRSKFLQQAVTEYMTRHIVHGGNELSPNVHDMSIDRRVAVGLAAIQEANREGIQLHKGVMDALRRELGLSEVQEAAGMSMQEAYERAVAKREEEDAGKVKRIYRLKSGLYLVEREGGEASRIVKEGNEWVRIDPNGQRVINNRLNDAKEQAYRDFGRVEVV